MGRRLGALGALLLGGSMVVAPLPTGAAPAPGATPSLELVTQTPVAVPGEAFVATVRTDGVPADGSIAINLHQRVRSRSELALSMEGEGLGSLVYQTVTPLSAVPAGADGARDIAIPLAPAPGGLPLPTEGVYPLELVAQDAAGRAVTSLVTHLIVPPDDGDDAPDLAVAAVVEVEAPIALHPDGTVRLSRPDVDGLAELVEGLAAAPGVPATLSIQPETVEALLGSSEPSDPALVTTLADTTAGRTVLSRPWVPLDVDSLAAAELLTEVQPQLQRGEAVLADALGVRPDRDVALAPPTLGADGLGVLAYAGTDRLVVDDEHLEALPPGIISYSLAQPFVVAVPEDADADERQPGAVLGLAPDPIVMERLEDDGAPGLVVSRVLAELALLRLEQPSVARATVLRLRPGLDAAVVGQLLEALGSGRPFAAVRLSEAFDHAAPVVDGAGNPVDRALDPVPPGDIAPAVAQRIQVGRADLATFSSMVGPTSELPDRPSRHLLVASAAGLDDGDRRAHLDAAAAEIESVEAGVSTPATFTLTLTARDGTIPLTIRNDSDVTLRVSVRLHSQKLEFPEGDTIELELSEPTTRIDIPVRSRSSGAFPLRIDVRTPDGRHSLSMSRYTVRSTAISGAGLVLSLGAGLFLAVWWARHWHKTRRSQKLIATDAHPSARA